MTERPAREGWAARVGSHGHRPRNGGPAARRDAGQRHPAAATASGGLRELMARMGHSTTHPALNYQHRAAGRDRLIADSMGKLAEAELMARNGPTGTQWARKEPTR